MDYKSLNKIRTNKSVKKASKKARRKEGRKEGRGRERKKERKRWIRKALSYSRTPTNNYKRYDGVGKSSMDAKITR